MKLESQQTSRLKVPTKVLRAYAHASRRFKKSASKAMGAKRRSDYHGNIETYRGGICGRLLALSLRLARESVKRSRGALLVGHQHRDR